MLRRNIKGFLDIYFAPTLSPRVQSFNLIGFIGIAMSVLAALSALVARIGPVVVVLNLLSSIVGVICFSYVRRTNRYADGYLFVVVVVFIVVFPVLFFHKGGYSGGMPCFFVCAIVFTAVMLEGVVRTIYIAVEFMVYASCFYMAYRYPEMVRHLETEWLHLFDVFTSIAFVGIALTQVVLLHTRIYTSRQEQIDEVDKLKTQFYQDMHHEMKTPLAVIISDINNADDMLSFDMDKSAIHECLEHAQQEIENLARLVEYSLSIAAAEEGRRRMEALDLADILWRRGEAFRTLLLRNGNKVSFRITEGVPRVNGNKDMLNQAINNLLNNANKHTRNGEITLSLTREDGHLIVSISDTGSGISPDFLPKIWERGISGAGTTGYGLSICKTIVEMHDGEIWVDSTLGEGATVYFSLPV